MFQLDDHPATLTNLNSRIERHGEDRQLAVDIKFDLQASNEILESIQPGLRDSLFRKPGKGEQQALPIDGNVLTQVKFPSLAPVSLTHEFTGYEIEIGGELESTDPIVLVDVKVKKITIAALEGGSVTLTFTASCEAEPADLTDLAEALIRKGVLLSMTPPAKQDEANNQEPQKDAA
jgi:hypothetical protein